VVRRPNRLQAILAGALLAAGLSAIAHAATPTEGVPASDFATQSGGMGPQLPHRSLQWDARTGRWGLDLEMPQPTYGSEQWGQTRIGVHYRVGTNLRVGPTVTLAPEQTPDGRELYQQQSAPRVRLETTLKF
jgi:hypothetical protein